MFWFTGPSPGQIQNTVLVHSVSAHTIVHALTECTSTVFCIWPDDGPVNRNLLL